VSKIAEFTKLVNDHDLTYSYSDDGRVWQRGQNQRDKIVALAKEIDLETVRTIWNAKVDRTLVEGYREPFYWKG